MGRARLALFVLALSACSLGETAEPTAGRVGVGTPGYLTQRLRRLSARELGRTIEDVTGIVVPIERLEPLVLPRKYDNGDPDAWVTPDIFDSIENIAWFVADEVVKTKAPSVYAGCVDRTTCRQQLLGSVLPALFRRPLTTAEDARYGRLFDDAARDESDEGVRSFLAGALQSPAFLYRSEIGASSGLHSIAFLEPVEVASQISYLVTGSSPDAELTAAAREERLATREQRLAQVERLLATPAAAEVQRRFLGLYLATEDTRLVRKAPVLFPGFDSKPLGADLASMLRDIVARGGSASALLGDPHALPRDLQKTYGGGPPITGALMHPAFLATHGGYENSNPVARGLYVLTNILCATPPPPPVGIPRAPSKDTQEKTTRGKFAEHSRGTCQTCHHAIDGIGFGFEEYDGAGAFRTTENGEPIDDSGVASIDHVETPYRGVAQLTASLAHSQQVADCFAKHVVRFALGSSERKSEASVYEGLAAGTTSDTTFAAHIRRIVASEAFVERRVP